jgi:hypothetical protein
MRSYDENSGSVQWLTDSHFHLGWAVWSAMTRCPTIYNVFVDDVHDMGALLNVRIGIPPRMSKDGRD